MGCFYAVFIALGGSHLLARRFSNPDIVATLGYLVPVPLVTLPATLLAPVLVVREQVHRLAAFTVITNLALAIAVILACLCWKDPKAIIATYVAASCVIGLLSIGMIVRALPNDSWQPSFHGLKQVILFSLPLMAASVVSTISLQLDKIIVASLCNTADFAVYSVGAMELPIIGMITGAVMSVILPELRKLIHEGKTHAALALFRRAACKSAVVLIPVMFFLLAAAEPFIVTLFPDYAESAHPFRFYLLTIPMRIVVFGALISALGDNHTILYRSITGLIVTATLSYLLVSSVGYIGAIVATLISLYLVEGLWCLIAISKLAKCEWREILPFRDLCQLSMLSGFASLPTWATNYWLAESLHPLLLLCLCAALFISHLFAVIWLLDVGFLQNELSSAFNKLLPKPITATVQTKPKNKKQSPKSHMGPT
jgi:O-antigen/teichoic acid export membrane protein